MASFLGIGAGILFGRDDHRIPLSPFAVLLLATTFLIGSLTLQVDIPTSGEVFFGLSESSRTNPGFIVLALIVVLTSLLMAFLALPLGRLLTSMTPLRAYAVDIAGAMTGIAALAALSALGTPPAAWFAVMATVLGLIALGTGVTRWQPISGGSLVGAIALSIVQQPATTAWSPYYRVAEQSVGSTLVLTVNGIPHQVLWPAASPAKEGFYEQAYRWFPERTFERVLIVGAGSGTDTAVALAHGAGHVDAVEIDTYLQEVGVRKHPDRPYDDPRVTRTSMTAEPSSGALPTDTISSSSPCRTPSPLWARRRTSVSNRSCSRRRPFRPSGTT
jgi:hypothetical protein